MLLLKSYPNNKADGFANLYINARKSKHILLCMIIYKYGM